MGPAGFWGHWNSLEPLSAELVVAGISSSEFFSFVRKDLKNRSHRRRQTVKTQFSKDDVEDYDLLVCWNVDDDINDDDGVLG
jgi:hypothetical protein